MSTITRHEAVQPITGGLRRRVFPTSLGPVAVRYLTEGGGRRASRGTADVYLHGAAGSWTAFIPLLSVPSGRDAVLLDLPGWGESTDGVRPRELGVETMAVAVTSILDTLGYRCWNLVGHSMGGFLALHIAATQPERTASVCAISGTTFGVAAAVRHPVLGFLRLPAFAGMLLAMRGAALLAGPGSALIRGIGKTRLLRRLLSPLFAHPQRIEGPVISGLADDARPASFSAAAAALAGYDFGQWRAISCPVLATRGDRDVFTPPGDLVELVALVPQAICLTVADCGHFANIEQPEAIRAMLRQLQAGAGPAT